MKKTSFICSYFMILFALFLNLGSSVEAAEIPLQSSYKVNTVWATAFQATVTITNTSSGPTSSWTATFTLPQGYSMSPNAPTPGATVSGQNVTVKSSGSNGIISAGGTKTFNIMVVKPLSAANILNNLQAVGNSTTSPAIPAPPVLNPIQKTAPQNYTVSWNSVNSATSYILQQDTTNSFANPQVVAQGNIQTKSFTNQPFGTYYYRVLAQNAAGNSPFSNIQSITLTQTAPTPPAAPVLNAIQTTSAQSYTVSWNAVNTATSYILQQDTTNSFSNPQVVAQGNILTKSFVNQAFGTYYYRVLAQNAVGNSPFSNIQSVTLTESPPNNLGIEHSAWYIDWTSWFTGPPFVIPANNDVLNIFVGTLMFGTDNKPTVGGFGNMTLPQMDLFTAYCAAQQPPIAVKVSIGGAGGMYDHCWDLLTAENVNAFAQGMVDFCHAHNLIGVDFDYEGSRGPNQDNLVGMLIKEFKTIDPDLQSSLCTNAGFGPNFPWQAVVQNVLNAATLAPGNNAVDRVYIMSYYDPIEAEQNWVNGWANWLITNYGFTPARVSVGIDDFDAHAYDPVVFAAWAASMGYSTAHWAFDPARPN